MKGYVKLHVGVVKLAIMKQIGLEIKSVGQNFLDGYNEYAIENNSKLNKWWNKLLKIKFIPLITKEDFSVKLVGAKFEFKSNDNGNITELMRKFERKMAKISALSLYSYPEFAHLFVFGRGNYYEFCQFEKLIQFYNNINKVENTAEILVDVNSLNLIDKDISIENV